MLVHVLPMCVFREMDRNKQKVLLKTVLYLFLCFVFTMK